MRKSTQPESAVAGQARYSQSWGSLKRERAAPAAGSASPLERGARPRGRARFSARKLKAAPGKELCSGSSSRSALHSSTRSPLRRRSRAARSAALATAGACRLSSASTAPSRRPLDMVIKSGSLLTSIASMASLTRLSRAWAPRGAPPSLPGAPEPLSAGSFALQGRSTLPKGVVGRRRVLTGHGAARQQIRVHCLVARSGTWEHGDAPRAPSQRGVTALSLSALLLEVVDHANESPGACRRVSGGSAARARPLPGGPERGLGAAGPGSQERALDAAVALSAAAPLDNAERQGAHNPLWAQPRWLRKVS